MASSLIAFVYPCFQAERYQRTALLEKERSPRLTASGWNQEGVYKYNHTERVYQRPQSEAPKLSPVSWLSLEVFLRSERGRNMMVRHEYPRIGSVQAYSIRKRLLEKNFYKSMRSSLPYHGSTHRKIIYLSSHDKRGHHEVAPHRTMNHMNHKKRRRRRKNFGPLTSSNNKSSHSIPSTYVLQLNSCG